MEDDDDGITKNIYDIQSIGEGQRDRNVFDDEKNEIEMQQILEFCMLLDESCICDSRLCDIQMPCDNLCQFLKIKMKLQIKMKLCKVSSGERPLYGHVSGTTRREKITDEKAVLWCMQDDANLLFSF